MSFCQLMILQKSNYIGHSCLILRDYRYAQKTKYPEGNPRQEKKAEEMSRRSEIIPY